MDISKFIEWIKLTPRYLLPIALVSGFLLFAPNTVQKVFGTLKFVEQFRFWIGLIFLLSTSLTISDLTIKTIALVSKNIKAKRTSNNMVKQLYSLSPEERTILARYIFGNTKTLPLSVASGVVNGLEIMKIIFKSSHLAYLVDSWPYNIQPWVWVYLNEHKDEYFTEEDKNNFENSLRKA